MIPDEIPVLLGVAAGATAIGWFLLWRARRADRRNWFIERAPELPLRLVSASDDVWTNGTVVCDAPLSIPYFDVRCAHYRYKIEEEVRRTRKNSKGETETYYTWETRHSESDSTDFWIVDGDDGIIVRSSEAQFDQLESTDTSYQTSRLRHSASYFAPGGHAEVVGLIDEEGQTIGDGQNIPLVVTRRPRAEYIKSIERSEGLLRGFGLFFLWAGLSTASLAGPVALGWFRPLRGGSELVAPLIVAGLLGLVPLSVLFGVYTYNTLVAWRGRVRNSWRLIDIDLKNRYDLIPQLVTVIQAGAAHEQELLEQVSTLRSGYIDGGIAARVGQEAEASRAVSSFLALQEAYPDLKSNELYAQLRDTLTALEDKIAHDREFYNESATEYRNLLEKFPHVIVARLGKFEALPLFRLEDS
jgi:LemA protein